MNLTLPENHIAVTVRSPEGKTYTAAMNGYWNASTPCIARFVEDAGGWSHGMLRDGEELVSDVPHFSNWSTPSRR